MEGKRNNLIYIFLFLFGFCLHAQDFKPGKVTIEDLNEKIHPQDTAAPAAILHKIGKTHFAVEGGYWILITEVTVRMKIYKKEGYKHANQEISYYTGGKTIKAYFNDACTYNLLGGEVVKTKLKSDGEFRERIDDEFERRKIILPNVREGSIIEFTSVIRSPYYSIFRDWYFQYEIPCNYIEYKVSIPQFFFYNRYLSGYLKVEKSETKYSVPPGMNYQEYSNVFWARNVKPLKKEAFVYNIDNYTAILKHELSSTNFGTSVNHYSSDWPAVAKAIYDRDNFGRELNRDSYYKDELAIVLADVQTKTEKAEKIFDYVKKRMNWNGESSYYCEKGVKEAFDSRTGNTAEINLMLTAMLRSVGLDANPVLVSTRTNGVALYPTYSAYNYVVAGLETESGTKLLDATSKFTTPDILPVRALNWEGRMIEKNGATKEINLRPKKKSGKMISMSATLDSEGNVSGKVRENMQDYYAYVFRENYADANADAYIEKIEKSYDGIQISNYKITGVKELDKPVLEEYNFIHKNVSDVAGNKIYISPMLFFVSTENPFKQEERVYPVDFNFPWQDKYILTITIPKGYVIESMPKSVALSMQDNIGAFKYNVVAQENNIQVSVSFDMNYANISQDYYKALKDFYQGIIDKQNEKIVLKKA